MEQIQAEQREPLQKVQLLQEPAQSRCQQQWFAKDAVQLQSSQQDDASLIALLVTEAHEAAAGQAVAKPTFLPMPVAQELPLDGSEAPEILVTPRSQAATQAAAEKLAEVSVFDAPLSLEVLSLRTAAAWQLQWVREALILLRRIEDPQLVQLQRKKKFSPAAASFRCPAVAPALGSNALFDDLSDPSAAPCCLVTQKPTQEFPADNTRLLYILWVGVGGGPWGGRSSAWLQYKR